MKETKRNKKGIIAGSWVLFSFQQAFMAVFTILFFRPSLSHCVNEAGTDLPTYFLASYLATEQHAEQLTVCTVLWIRSMLFVTDDCSISEKVYTNTFVFALGR